MAGAPGLGMLAQMGSGMAQGPDSGTGDPQALLAQIRDLLEQYLALGGDTPVASQAQALADAIDGDAGSNDGAGAADALVPPPDDTSGDAETSADALSPLEEPDPEAYSGSDMSKARDGAKAFLKKKNKAKA